MMHALSFVSMGVEARCCPSKSTAHCRHMKMQPFLCNGHPCCGRHHCHCCCRCHRRNHPLLSPLPSAIAIAVAVNHCRRHLCCVAVSHRCHRRPCRRPLPSPSPSAIAVAIAIGHHRCHAVNHFQELLPWRGKNCIQQLKQRMLTLFYLFRQWAVH